MLVLFICKIAVTIQYNDSNLQTYMYMATICKSMKLFTILFTLRQPFCVTGTACIVCILLYVVFHTVNMTDYIGKMHNHSHDYQ